MVGKASYELLLSRGICPTCGMHPVMQEKTRCQHCATTQGKYWKNRSKSGKCIICNTPIYPTGNERHTRCFDCRKKLRIYANERYKRIKALGLCVQCEHKPQRENRSSCEDCSKKDNEYAMIKRAMKKLENDQH